MRVLLAPDGFGSTLTALEAAAAMASGWSAARPFDEVAVAAQSDGGPGFVDVLAGCGVVHETAVAGPLGPPVRARWLLTADSVAYLEAAQACGLHLLGGGPTPRAAVAASTFGVGEMIADALGAGARRLVIGLGGSASTDGGRGMVDALGGLDRYLDLLRPVPLLAASDVANPLLGPAGAAAVYGPQKGADAPTIALLERRLAQWSAQLAAASGIAVGGLAGGGAAGGLGAALLAAGAGLRPGADVVGERTGRRAAMAAADVVLTGEGRLDGQTLQGKVVARLAAEAREVGTPLIVLAGQVSLTESQLVELGTRAVYSLTEFAGSVAAAMAAAPVQLEALTRIVAVEWRE
ncbi:glycerate kinase family protein [Tomitella biformata]|uniref:glycerate kinase family protein n=1 Tax=Tomitella biformata TaxID=630403 RepID=UPI000467348D|nr:glycerate kinase [Tomitella biformata]